MRPAPPALVKRPVGLEPSKRKTAGFAYSGIRLTSQSNNACHGALNLNCAMSDLVGIADEGAARPSTPRRSDRPDQSVVRRRDPGRRSFPEPLEFRAQALQG
jgi:hypothetical protein